MVSKQEIYHHLPYTLRVVAASAFGYYLKSWRYDRTTDSLIQAALERDCWTKEKWDEWQEERLSYILSRAATKVPYYKKYWMNRRIHGDNSSFEYLENWPLLKKDIVRQYPHAFLAEDCNHRKMYVEHTSGSTGTPLTLWWSKKTVKEWFALFDARLRGWYGVSRRNRWAIFGGQVVTPYKQIRPPFWVWNYALRQLYMSVYHLSPKNIGAYINALNKYQVEYIVGYPSALYTLCSEAYEQNVSSPKIKVIVSNAEPLYPYQKEIIQNYFQCPVFDSYGMAEIVSAGSECTAGVMHTWPEVGVVQVLSDIDDEVISDGSLGRFICTGLLNEDMPLIRYEIGDRGAKKDLVNYCSCGRYMPVLEQIEGRLADVIVTPDGRKIGRVAHVVEAGVPVKEVQIIQETIDQILVRVVPATGFKDENKVDIIQHLSARLGKMKIKVETVASIPRTERGKFRMVISNINQQQL